MLRFVFIVLLVVLALRGLRGLFAPLPPSGARRGEVAPPHDGTPLKDVPESDYSWRGDDEGSAGSA